VLRFVTRRHGAFTQTRGRKPVAGVAAQKIIRGGGSFSGHAAMAQETEVPGWTRQSIREPTVL